MPVVAFFKFMGLLYRLIQGKHKQIFLSEKQTWSLDTWYIESPIGPLPSLPKGDCHLRIEITSCSDKLRKLEIVLKKHCAPNHKLVDKDDLTILFTR